MVNRDLTTAPEYYVEDADDCEDQVAVAIMEAINRRVNALIDSDEIDRFYPEPCCRPVDVNRGHCEAVVIYVYDSLVEAGFDEEKIEILNRVFIPYGVDKQRHSWIAYHAPNGKDYHFDAECPWGVHPWYYLPTFHRHPNEFNQPEIQFYTADPRNDPYNCIRGFVGMHGDVSTEVPSWVSE